MSLISGFQTLRYQARLLFLAVASGALLSGCSGLFVSGPLETSSGCVMSGSLLNLDPSKPFISGCYHDVDLTTLTAAVVCAGHSLFGIDGTAVCLSGQSSEAGAGADLLLGKELWDSSGNKVIGTIPIRSHAEGTDGSLVNLIPMGFYDGTKAFTAKDSHLTAGSICVNDTIFGVSGSAICQKETGTNLATESDMIAGKEAWNSAGQKLTGTIQNRGTLNLKSPWPGAGYYGNMPINIPDSSQMCQNATVLGITGTGPCDGEQSYVLNSYANRDKYAGPITWVQEVNRGICSDSSYVTRLSCETSGATWTPYSLPSGYRAVADVTKDDDGFVAASTTSSEIIMAGRPTVDCGSTQTTIHARITDCASKNGLNAAWDGAQMGNYGYGTWKLVSRIGLNKEVWQDQRTRLLWSSQVTTAANWCRAAGNVQGNDPSNICNNTSYQNQTTPISWCVELSSLNPAGSENWTIGTYLSAKGGMGKIATTTSPSVLWRLPTLYDYLQANLNGIRFVMPDMIAGTASNEWTSTVAGNARNTAWKFTTTNGVITNTSATRSTSAPVRCVGR